MKDKPEFGKLYIVRGKSGQKLSTDLIVVLAAGVEGDLTLIADFRLSEIKQAPKRQRKP